MSVDMIPVKYQIHKKGAIGFDKQFLKFTRIICKLEKQYTLIRAYGCTNIIMESLLKYIKYKSWMKSVLLYAAYVTSVLHQACAIEA